MGEFLPRLAATLAAMHNAGREPVHQSVRGGSQTAGQLFGRDNPIIQAIQARLHEAVERWLAQLPEDARHPFLAYRQRSVRYTGSWSVRLQAAGHHSNHIHPRGWASSAFHVALPERVHRHDESSQDGGLQFGQPLETLGLDLPPRRVVQPRPGYLALFPSYLWHGTVPFAGPLPRTTIAFDMQPRA